MTQRQGDKDAKGGSPDAGSSGSHIERGPDPSNKEPDRVGRVRAPYRRRGKIKQGHYQGEIYAALDLGTNNCRLLVAKPIKDNFKVIDAFSRIVRLGEGLSGTGVLSPTAMERALAALHICAKKMHSRGVTQARCVATEACRKAKNGPEFVERVKRETGIKLDVIQGAEEARLAAAGCVPLIRPDVSHAIVFDIGGGSTELMWMKVDCSKLNRPWPRNIDALTVLAWTSLSEGVVTLAERHGGLDISETTYDEMVASVRTNLEEFDCAHGLMGHIRRNQVQMLGTSGTVTTLAGVHLDLPRYERSLVDGLGMSFDDGIDASRKLAAMSYKDRAQHPCIGHQRADLVVAGCAIFEAICETWPVGDFTVADRGLREGILQSLFSSHREAGDDQMIKNSYCSPAR